MFNNRKQIEKNAPTRGTVMAMKTTSPRSKNFVSIGIKEDQIVERFTQMANYKLQYQKFKDEYCTNMSEQMKKYFTPTIEELRVQSMVHKSQLLRHREELLEQMRQFREAAESVARDDLPLLISHWERKKADAESKTVESKPTI